MTTYTNPRLEAVIHDWPSGGKRVTATFLIDTNPRGQRAIRTTTDPKTGRASAPKVLTYAAQTRIVDGDDGRTYLIQHTPAYRHISVMQGGMQFQHEVIYSDDPRYAEVMALFGSEMETVEA